MNLVEEGGRFYAPGTSPGEVLAVFQMCDDLVSQMVPVLPEAGDLQRNQGGDGELR